MLKYCIFVITLISTANIVSGRIECYQCSSSIAEECGSKFHRGISTASCEEPNAVCFMKVTPRQPFSDLVVRGCGNSHALCSGPGFIDCFTCQDNLCNGAGHKGATIGGVIPVVFLLSWLYFTSN